MGQISAFLRKVDVGYAHYCPACKQTHVYYVDKPTRRGARWGFDGNIDKPTFTPSMNIGWGDEKRPATMGRCHYFITDGQIRYCGDCTHDLKGQTVPLPELPLHYRDPYCHADHDVWDT